MELFLILIVVGLLVEAIVETLRLAWDASTRKISLPVVLSLMIGLVISFGLQLNIFSALPLADTPPSWLGCAITGILVSRGSNFIHDLWSKINSAKNIE